jgi:uncharacterized cupredoxin-like copper-binding protein
MKKEATLLFRLTAIALATGLFIAAPAVLAHGDAHVKPGGTEEMIWKFTKAGDFNYGCLAPGHFEAGMLGKIKVVKGEAATTETTPRETP